MNAEYYGEEPHHSHSHHQRQPFPGEGGVELGPGDFISDAEFERRFGQAPVAPAHNHPAHTHFRPPGAVIGPDGFEAYGRGGPVSGYDPRYQYPYPISEGYYPNDNGPIPLPVPNRAHYEGEYPPIQGYSGPGFPQPHLYSHISQMASAHDQDTDPALFEQAAHQLHHTTTHVNHAPYEASDYEAHFAAHAQAYSPEFEQSYGMMDSDAIGSAAAIQAFKMSAAQPQAHPAQSHATQPHPHPNQPHPTQPHAPPVQHHPDHNKPPAPAAASHPTGGSSSPQDKIVAIAMAQAAKLFDKKNGGSPANPGSSEAKLKAMHSAALTAMRLATEYTTSGKVSLQPGEMHTLIAAAMSII